MSKTGLADEREGAGLKNIIAITGLKGSGKDTAAEILLWEGYKKEKFAGALKEMDAALLRYRGLPEAMINNFVDGDWKVRSSHLYHHPVPAYAMMEAFFIYCGVPHSRMMSYVYGDQDNEPLDLLCGKTTFEVVTLLHTDWHDMLMMFDEPTPRNSQQTLGTDIFRDKVGYDVWLNAFKMRLASYGPNDSVVVTDMRFPNEAELMGEIGAIRVRIERPGQMTDAESLHESERHIPSLPVEFVVNNNTTANDLQQQLYNIVNFGSL